MSRQAAMRGFTLIEILITLLVVSIAVLSLGSFGFSSLRSGQISNERLTAVHLAEQVLEHWQNDVNDRAPTISATCVQSDATGNLNYPVISTCTPQTGAGISYTVTVNVATATGPLVGSGNSIAIGQFSQPTGYVNTPITKVVTVGWSNNGKSHSIYLTHISKVQ